MTTMPPEMSTATVNAAPSVTALTPANVSRESLSTLQASRSRFMITDILAAHQNVAHATHSLQGPASLQQHRHHQHNHHLQQQQQQQQQQALQHYIAQQQHLLQQRHHLNGSPTLPSPLPTALSPAALLSDRTLAKSATHATSLTPAATIGQGHSQNQGQLQTAHLSHHSHTYDTLPATALMDFPGVPNGMHIAQAAAQYANLQYQERERAGVERGLILHDDDRSRSPHHHQHHSHQNHPTAQSTHNLNNVSRDALMSGGNSGGGGGGGNVGGGGGCGGSSSISGDQASTIDDSDSDCGAKDDDGHSVKSNDNLMGLTKKQRKARTAFTDHQLQTLEKSFERQKYLSVQDRMELANKLELSDCQVKTWYQNRRTKWKRQTAVGLELLAEAGNYAAFQRLYGGSPYLAPWPYAAAQASSHLTPTTPIDLYYRQAAAAAVLQKPLSYRMYPSVPAPLSTAAISGLPVHAPSPMTHLGASNSLSSLSNYYQTATQSLSNCNTSFTTSNTTLPHRHSISSSRSDDDEQQQQQQQQQQHNSVEIINRSPSPQLNPGSPPERTDSPSSCNPASEMESDGENATIEV